MWAPAVAPARAALRVLHERVVDGVPQPVGGQPFQQGDQGTAGARAGRGGAAPASVDELVAVLRDLKHTVEERPAPAGRPRQLDLVVAEL